MTDWLVSVLAGMLLPALAAQSAGTVRGSTRRDATASNAPATIGDQPQTVAPRTVLGRVLNGLTGAPVPRALVVLSTRVTMTDAQGNFSFPEFAATTAYAQVTKPGYTFSLTPESQRQQQIKNLDSVVELKLYPNALLTGLVTGTDGLPLSRVPVQLSRLSFDSTGPRWYPSGFAQTDTHGDYRFDIPAGRYRVLTAYLPRSVERGEAVLPVGFPSFTSSNTESFQVSAGEQKQVNLRPRVGPVYPVTVILEGSVDTDRGTRMTAVTSGGSSFQLPIQRNGEQDIVQLPAGTFLLRAVKGDRDNQTTGEARVLVNPSGLNQATIELASLPRFTVETSFELDSAVNANQSNTTPGLQQFNLSMHDFGSLSANGFTTDNRPVLSPDHSAAYFQLQSGRYRLGGNNTGDWYVRAATSGVTNLLTDDLVVAQGASGSPLRVILSNASGRLNGMVKTNGQPGTGWVYLIAKQPALVASSEIYIQTDGSFAWRGPPGKYLVVASPSIVREDFRNVPFLHKFAASAQEVEITPGGQATVDLTLAPEGVAR